MTNFDERTRFSVFSAPNLDTQIKLGYIGRKLKDMPDVGQEILVSAQDGSGKQFIAVVEKHCKGRQEFIARIVRERRKR